MQSRWCAKIQLPDWWRPSKDHINLLFYEHRPRLIVLWEMNRQGCSKYLRNYKYPPSSVFTERIPSHPLSTRHLTIKTLQRNISSQSISKSSIMQFKAIAVFFAAVSSVYVPAFPVRSLIPSQLTMLQLGLGEIPPNQHAKRVHQHSTPRMSALDDKSTCLDYLHFDRHRHVDGRMCRLHGDGGEVGRLWTWSRELHPVPFEFDEWQDGCSGGC